MPPGNTIDGQEVLRSGGGAIVALAGEAGLGYATAGGPPKDGFPIVPETFRTVVWDKHQRGDQHSHVPQLLTS
jgi:hypothetical protein